MPQIQQENFGNMLGLVLAFTCLMSSALSTIFIKKLSPHLSHYQISASIGLAIVVFGFMGLAADQAFCHIKALKINHLFLDSMVIR